MNAQRWKRIAELLESALGLDARERRALYARECGDDPTLGAEVERLVAADTDARGFLELAPPPPAAPRPFVEGARIGSYTLVRRIAAGGMGVVFEARQERPSRRVALKLVQALLVDESTLRRFRYEAEALGRLRHAGIAQVYEAGVDVDAEGNERPFLAMEYVDGARPATSYVHENALDFAAIAALFVDVCEAVQHGHERGVLHRDLKASNVLVDSSGHVKVIDFGIARVLGDPSTRATLAGELVGTLASMSPEQLDGDVDAVDVRSDVYALGSLLYEMLCGVPPVDLRGLSLNEALTRAREAVPTAPTRVRVDVPRELEWIVMRALEPDRERRYASAAEFARDLERFLRDEPVNAGPPSTAYRLRKFVRRNRTVVSSAVVVAIAILGGAVLAIVQRNEAVFARENADVAKDRAEEAEQLAVERLARIEAEARTNRELAEFQGQILKSADPDQDGREVRVVDVLARAGAGLDERAGLDPQIELALRRSVADAYTALGLPHEANVQVQRMVPIWEARFAPTDPVRLDLELVRMANDAFLAPPREREQRARDGLARATSVLGQDSRNAALWSAALAVALADLGRPEEAEPFVRSAVETLRARTGAVSADTLDASLILGRVLNDSRRYDEAEQWKRATYETCLAALGEDRAETLRLKKQLAFAVGTNGRVEEAVTLLREVVEAHARRTGAATAAALVVRADLAEFLRRAKRYAEALTEIESALADGRRVLGDEHTFVYSSSLRRCWTLLALGRGDEGLTVTQELLERARRERGPGDRTTLEIQTALARMLYTFARYEDALPHAREAWERSADTLGEDNPTTLNRGNSYAVLLSDTGRGKEAGAVLESLLRGQERQLGRLHTNTLLTLCSVSTIQLNLGETRSAVCWADEFLARVQEKGESSPDEWARAWWTLGRARRAVGDQEQAAACFAAASHCWARSREAVSRSSVGGLIDESMTLEALGRADEARIVLADAARLAFDRQVPPDTGARALATYARALSTAGEKDAARDLAQYVLALSTPIPDAVRRIAQDVVDPR